MALRDLVMEALPWMLGLVFLAHTTNVNVHQFLQITFINNNWMPISLQWLPQKADEHAVLHMKTVLFSPSNCLTAISNNAIKTI